MFTYSLGPPEERHCLEGQGKYSEINLLLQENQSSIFIGELHFIRIAMVICVDPPQK